MSRHSRAALQLREFSLHLCAILETIRFESMNSLLIIDDEAVIRRLLSRILGLEGYEVVEAGDCAGALRQLKRKEIDVALCDVFLPDGNGVDFVQAIKKVSPRTEVVLLTAHGNIADGVRAIKNGAFDYITKGDDNNKIIPIVSRAMEASARRDAGMRTDAGKGASTVYTFDSIKGCSPAIRRAVELARKVAAADVAVLLCGETGTGKELFAQAIHAGGARSGRPFVAVNCSAFSKDLLESELFGYKAGAFTGAVKDKPGILETADKGTIFLDEIGEMSTDLQAKLLRVLEEKSYIKVGDTRPTRIDVRVISATNRDLTKEIAAGRFREDLYYRLSVFCVELPPLRDREGDVELLADLFAGQFSRRMGKPFSGISPECMRILKAARWRGNIRELRNVVERGLVICDDRLTPADLPVEMQRGADLSDEPSAMDLASVEKRHIAKVLRHVGGNKTEASRLLKIGLTTLYRKIEEYGL